MYLSVLRQVRNYIIGIRFVWLRLSTQHIFFCRYMLSCIRLLTLLSIIRTASTPKGALGHAIVWLASFIASPVLLPATESGEAGVVQSLHTQLTGVGLRSGSFLLP